MKEEVKVRGIVGAWLSSANKCSSRLGKNGMVGPPAGERGSQDM